MDCEQLSYCIKQTFDLQYNCSNSKEEYNMNNNKIKSVIKGILISVISLGVGFFAISLPFQIFTLSQQMMHIVFIGELVIYSIMGGVFLAANEKSKAKKAQKLQQKVVRQERRIEQLKALEQFNMVA